MKEETRLTIPVEGNIIFGYPPVLPLPEVIILETPKATNQKPFSVLKFHAGKTCKRIQRVLSLRRTGIRSSKKI